MFLAIPTVVTKFKGPGPCFGLAGLPVVPRQAVVVAGTIQGKAGKPGKAGKAGKTGPGQT